MRLGWYKAALVVWLRWRAWYEARAGAWNLRAHNIYTKDHDPAWAEDFNRRKMAKDFNRWWSPNLTPPSVEAMAEVTLTRLKEIEDAIRVG